MEKKASMAGLGAMILVLAVLIILIIAFIKFSSKASGYLDREPCRMSAIGQATAKDIILSSNAMETSCKTNTLRFYNDHVEINGKTISVVDARKKAVVKKFNGLTDDIVNQVMAEELRWCWYQFLEGKRNLFESNSLVPSLSDLTCFICDDVSFDNTVRVSQFNGFFDYLQQKTMVNSNITYYKYLAQNDRLCAPKIYLPKLAPLAPSLSVVYSSSEECWRSVLEGEEKASFEMDKNYYLAFIKRGINANADKIMNKINPFPGTSNIETYFAYAFDSTSYGQCNVVKRGVTQ